MNNNFTVDFYQDDPDILAKSRFQHEGMDYEITIVTASPGGCTNKYLPDVFQTSETDLTIAFDGEYFEQQINAAVAQAQEELEEIENTTDYPNHIGSAAASVMSMYLNRALLAAKKFITRSNPDSPDIYGATSPGINLFYEDEDES
tara:strand:+ start:1046 stop:1483 length:438 start_codon:yes stop_codon:yes gene_type:complete